MKAIVENRQAKFEYDLIDTYNAGLELRGFEVKSLRLGKASLIGSRIVVRGGEAYLIGATISPYQEGNTPKDYDPERSRRLLLTKKEIDEISGKESGKGLTIIPVMVYNDRHLKLRIAVAKKKKKYDKRETLKERDTKRSIERSLKNEYE